MKNNDNDTDSQDKVLLGEKRELYKKEQQERLDSMLPGAGDFLGNTISKVYSRGDEFVVYAIENASPYEPLKVRVDSQIEEDQEPVRRFQAIKDDFDKFKSVQYKTDADPSFIFRAATAVSLALQGDIDSARKLFCSICAEAEKEFREKLTGRLFYLSGALALVVILVILSVVAYLSRNGEFVRHNLTLIAYLHAVTFASIGGLITVSIRVQNLNIGKALRVSEYAIYGAERIMFATLGGIVIYTLLRAELILGPLVNQDTGQFAMLTFCFVAGFSETLIPNALANIETRSNKNLE